MEQTFNPCDECGYSVSKQNQDSGVCGICEFKQLRENTFSAVEMCKIKAALDQLKEYQKLEKQGKLLVKAYRVYISSECGQCGHKEWRLEETWVRPELLNGDDLYIYKTRREAEDALRDMQMSDKIQETQQDQ